MEEKTKKALWIPEELHKDIKVFAITNNMNIESATQLLLKLGFFPLARLFKLENFFPEHIRLVRHVACSGLDKMNAGVSQTQRLPLPLPGRLPLEPSRSGPLNPDLRGLLALPGDRPLPRPECPP